MSALPDGVIRVWIEGRPELVLVREFNWGPTLTVIDRLGRYWVVPARNFRPASDDETDFFWLNLEETIHRQHCNSRN